ncbi:MAG TPA: DNA-binding response regulator [Actinobacteria bacterium]|nr:DNA-binding response regulator [Actinomycetota bacterium]
MTIRVVIADDEALVRAGFRLILGTQADLEVVGEASNGHEAVDLTQKHAPDVILMDIRMPGLDGIAATRLIAGPGATWPSRVVILTTYDQDEYVYDALAAGASGYLLKDVQPEELTRGVRLVAAGDALLAPAVTRRLIAEFASHRRQVTSRDPSAATLTGREREILEHLARGKSNAEIASSLYLSENTVKTHVASVLGKLTLRDRVQAVIWAYENGIVEPGRPSL